MELQWTRWVIAGSLLYATYLVVQCPCDKPVSCTQPQFYAATLAPVAAVVALNMGSE